MYKYRSCQLVLAASYFMLWACGNDILNLGNKKLNTSETSYKTTYSFKDLELKSAGGWKYAIPSSNGYLLHASDGVVEKLDPEDRLTLVKPQGEEKGTSCPDVCFFNASSASFWMLKGKDISTLGKPIPEQQKQEVLKVELPAGIALGKRTDGVPKLLGVASHFSAFEGPDASVVLIRKSNESLVSSRLKFTAKDIGTERILGFEIYEAEDSAFLITDKRIKKGIKDKQQNLQWSDVQVFPPEISEPLKIALWASFRLDATSKNLLAGLIYSDGNKLFRMQSVTTSSGGTAAPKEFTPALEKIATNACAGCHDNRRGAGFASSNRAESWFGAQAGEILRRLEDKTMPPSYAEEFKTFDSVTAPKTVSDRNALVAWMKAAGVQPTKSGAGAKSVVSADPAKKEAQTKIFTTDIKPLVQQFCVRCHGAWEFENNFAMSLGNAKYKLGNSSMPKSGSPEATEIVKLSKVMPFVNFLDAYVKAGE